MFPDDTKCSFLGIIPLENSFSSSGELAEMVGRLEFMQISFFMSKGPEMLNGTIRFHADDDMQTVLIHWKA